MFLTLANAGGLLGLCMGFSVLSLLEILYYGSLRLCCTFYRNRISRRNHTPKRNERNNGKNDQQPRTSELSNYPKPAWFSQNVDNTFSDNKIDKNKRIFITKRKVEHDNDYDYYENYYNEYPGDNNRNIRHSEKQSIYLPGSFEDQLNRAFLATAFPEKR